MPALESRHFYWEQQVKRAKNKTSAPKPAGFYVTLGGKELRLEYNFLAYSVMRECDPTLSALDGIDLQKMTEGQYVVLLAAGLQTHHEDIDVKWMSKQLSLDNFQDVMDVAADAYIAGLPKRKPGEAVNPPKPAS